MVRKRRSAEKWKTRTARVSQQYSFNPDEGAISGRLQSKEEMEMDNVPSPISARLRPKEEMEVDNVPSTPAIRYPDDEFFVGGGRRRSIKEHWIGGLMSICRSKTIKP